MSLIGKFIDQILPIGSIILVSPDDSRETYGPGGGKQVAVKFHDRRVALDIFRNPRLKLGEAYMDGRLTIEDGGTILDLLELIVGAQPWEQGQRKALGKGKAGKLISLFRRNPVSKSRKNVAHHYDIGNELYALFLDDDLQYSCAYFTDAKNSLEQAQADKKAHIAAKLDLKPGQRVLDIGCGWGGMALYLHKVAGVDVLGITLSQEQLKVARQRAKDAGVSDHVQFELIDYRLLDDRFDRIVSIGKLGGAGTPAPFTDKWIFPGYHLPSLSQMCGSSEKVKMIVSDVETLRLHYAYTLRPWLARATTAPTKIVKLYDERFFRMWEFYLAGGIVMFESGAACNYQVQYVRDRRATPITRDYMLETERRYREIDAKPAPAAKKPRGAGRKKTLEDA